MAVRLAVKRGLLNPESACPFPHSGAGPDWGRGHQSSTTPTFLDLSAAQNTEAPTAKHYWILCAGTVLCLLSYRETFNVPFLFDDEGSILSNSSLKHIGDALYPPLTSGVGGRPLLNLSFALSYSVSGFSVWSYHALNILFHLLTGWCIFGVLCHTFAHQSVPESARSSSANLAAAASVIWMLHPLHTETVTYISQRAECLMGLFYVTALYAFIHSFRAGTKWGWLAFSSASCLAGALTKETIATAPLLILLYDRFFISPSFKAALRNRYSYYLSLTVTWMVLGFTSLRTLSLRGVGFSGKIGSIDYALLSFKSMATYLRLSVWPHPLIFDYGILGRPGATELFGSLFIIALAFTGLTVMTRRNPRVLYLGLWFTIILLPTTSFVPVYEQPLSEHRLYLSVAAISTGLILMLNRFGRSYLVAGFSVFALLFSWATYRRNLDYRSEISLWLDTTKKAPQNYRAHTNLGAALQTAGNIQSAANQYLMALRLNPKYPEANNDMGSLLMDSPRSQDQAIRYFEIALQGSPRLKDAHNNLAIVLSQRRDRLKEAITHFDQAIAIDPMDAELYFNRGMALAKITTRRDQSLADLHRALALNPNFTLAQRALASLQNSKAANPQ